MTPTHRPKLIEVALPLETIDRACAAEKSSIWRPNPTKLHIWWARRPLAAMRAVIWASLVDDPSCDDSLTEDQHQRRRRRLFRILEELLVWEKSNDQNVLRRARKEIDRSCKGVPPAILDPFGGGGSTALEVQRLGLTAMSGDLNPVAVLIQKALIEIPPRFSGRAPVNTNLQQQNYGWSSANGLAEDVAAYGQLMRDEAWQQIGHHYPNVIDDDGIELTPIAWIWVRTIPSPDPAWDGHVPLVKSWELKRRPNTPRVWFEPVIDRERQQVSFRIRVGGQPAFAPTIKRGNGTCLATGAAMPNEYIVEQFNARNAREQLVAIVADGGRGRGRVYVGADMTHVRAADTGLPAGSPTKAMQFHRQNVKAPRYGFKTWSDLFTPRQLTAMVTLSDLLPKVWVKVKQDAIKSGMPDDDMRLRDGGCGAAAYADAIITYLALAIDRLADYCNGLCTWHVSREQVRNLFARQAIPMSWDTCEANPFSSVGINWIWAIRGLAKALGQVPAVGHAIAQQRDARSWQFDQHGVVVCTDPPYYDNIDYSDISDFFYVWLRRNLINVWPDEFATLATPKVEELIADPYRHGGREQARDHFESGMREFLGKLAVQHRPDFPISIFYAYKAQEGRGGREGGWSTFLQAMVDAGLQITATWPIRTEQRTRTQAIGSNALASSVVLVCRPRQEDAAIVSRAEFVSEMRAQLPKALELLLQSNIAPVDLPQASIGPGMRIFSGFASVVQADGQNMRASTALALINQHLDEYFSGVEVELDSESRFAYDWYRQYGFASGPSGTADSIARARGTSLDGIRASAIGSAVAGKFQLTQLSDSGPAWDPDRDTHPTVWEAVHHLAANLEDSEMEAGRLYARLGILREGVRDLAYMLFRAAEERGDGVAARSYNGLVSALPVIAERSREATLEQSELI